MCTRLWKGLLVGNKLNDYSKNLGNPQDNLKSAFTLPLAGKDLASHVWKKVSPMNVGRATHACLATKFGVSQKKICHVLSQCKLCCINIRYSLFEEYEECAAKL